MARFNIPNKEGFLCAGVITQAHSLRGEVLFKNFLSQEEIYQKNLILLTIDDIEFKIETVRSSNKGLLIKFANIKNRNDAEKARKTYLYIKHDQLEETQEDELYYYQLNGYKIINDKKQILAEVCDVFDTGANTILDVKLLNPVEKNDKKVNKVLIPYTHDMVVSVDKINKFLEIDESYFSLYINL